jgi:hypothetical protein
MKHIKMCANEDKCDMSGCVTMRTNATCQDVCHGGYVQRIRTYATEDAIPYVVSIHLMLGHTKNI